MIIAILGEIISPKSGARAPIELAKHLSANHEIHFYAYKYRCDPTACQELKKLGIKIFLYPYFSPTHLARILPIPSLLINLRKNRYDFLLIHSFLPFFMAAKLSGIPFIRTYYGTQFDIWAEKYPPEKTATPIDIFVNRTLNRFIYLREKLCLSLSPLNIAISGYTQAEVKKLYGQTMSFVYLGADSAMIKSTPPSKKNKEFSFLSVSRITPYKNFHLLISAFKQVAEQFPQISLTLAGSAPNKKYLTYLKKMTGGNPRIKIRLNVSDTELKRLYQQSHVYLSADRFSFFGLPPLEAALYRLPTIAMNYAALPEMIVNKKTGLVVKDETELVEGMLSLAKNPILTNKFGENAYQRVKNKFTWSKCAREYEKQISGELQRKR